MGAKADYLGRARPLRRRLQARVMGVVTVEHGGTARLQAEKDFGLGIGDRLDRREKAEMRRLDRGHHGDVRPDQPRQGGDLAGMVHPELEDAIDRIGRHSGQETTARPNGC